MDENHDHRLSQEEFAAGCERVGFALSSTEVSEEFRRCDADGGGFVLFHEFCSWCAEQSLRLTVSLDDSGEGTRSVSQRCAIAICSYRCLLSVSLLHGSILDTATAARVSLKLSVVLNRLSPSGQALKPALTRTSLSGPPPSDPGTEEARKQAEMRAEIAARALSKKLSPKPANKQDRRSPIGGKRKGFAPIPEEKRFSPRRDIEDKMSPPNPQLVSPTAASLGKGVRSGVDGSPGSKPSQRGAKRPTSRETIFATNNALAHTHIEPADERYLH